MTLNNPPGNMPARWNANTLVLLMASANSQNFYDTIFVINNEDPNSPFRIGTVLILGKVTDYNDQYDKNTPKKMFSFKTAEWLELICPQDRLPEYITRFPAHKELLTPWLDDGISIEPMNTQIIISDVIARLAFCMAHRTASKD